MPEFWITMIDQLKESKVAVLILVGAGMFLVIGGLAALSHYYTLNGIKSKTVGDGQHGTARWATDKEIKQTYSTLSIARDIPEFSSRDVSVSFA